MLPDEKVLSIKYKTWQYRLRGFFVAIKESIMQTISKLTRSQPGSYCMLIGNHSEGSLIEDEVLRITAKGSEGHSYEDKIRYARGLCSVWMFTSRFGTYSCSVQSVP